jgi:tRNA dimethylallyltransferase
MFDVEPVPVAVREALEKELAVSGADLLHRELLAKDPQSKIHINDHYRLVRALEIIRHSGVTPTELQSRSIGANKYEFPFPFIKIGFDFEKGEYVSRVEKRTKQMITGGIVDEARACLEGGFADWAPMHSVGYRETLEFLTQNKSEDWLQAAIVQSTMQLIKKQKTWFKRDQSVLWSNQAQQLDQFLT